MKNRLVVALAFLGCSFVSKTAWPCTTFLAWHAGQPVVGKDYDWNQTAGLVTINPRGLQKRALVLSPADTPAVWTSKYGSLTFNQYGVEWPNGGMNEKGLVIEIMWLNSTRYPAADDRPVVNELQWIERALDLYATVDEMAKEAPALRVSQVYAQIHVLACDALGECAAFEYLGGQLVVSRGDKLLARTLTNNTYADSAHYLASFTGFGGTAPLPSSSDSLARFARASMLARTTEGTTIPDSAFSILDSVSQSSTVWSIVYAPKDGLVYFRTAAVPKVKSVRLRDFSLTCGTRKILDIDTDASGDVGTRFVDYSKTANRNLLAQSTSDIASQLPAGILDTLAAYPDTVTCTGGGSNGGSTAPSSGSSKSAPSKSGGACSMAANQQQGPVVLLMALLGALRRRRRSSPRD